MSTSLHDLARRVDAVVPPAIDVAELVSRGDRRARRRRAVLAAGVAALVVGVVAAGTALDRHERRSSGPLTPPTPTVTELPAPAPARPLTYADDYRTGGPPPFWKIRSIRYGDRTVRPGPEIVHLDLTDDGLALQATNGGIYFADGSGMTRIGTVAAQISWSDGDVKSGQAGSLLAWFSPARPTPSLVVYDGHDRAVVSRTSIPECRQDGACRVLAVVGDRVYVDPSWATSDSPRRPVLALDLTSGSVRRTDPRGLADEMRGRPRSLVKGDSFENGEVVSEEAPFTARDGFLGLRRLVSEPGVYATGGFDGTGRRLHLRLPDGFRPAAVDYSLFQWLDDDRFAVMSGAMHNEYGWNGFRGYGDILVCDIARQRCDLAAKGPSGGRYRLVPHLDVPN